MAVRRPRGRTRHRQGRLASGPTAGAFPVPMPGPPEPWDPVLPSSTAHTRFFNPTVGIVEDSATGTAAGPLACQLITRGVVKAGDLVVIEQGYEMGRPSLLRLEVHGDLVQLAGRCVTAVNGMLRIQ